MGTAGRMFLSSARATATSQNGTATQLEVLTSSTQRRATSEGAQVRFPAPSLWWAISTGTAGRMFLSSARATATSQNGTATQLEVLTSSTQRRATSEGAQVRFPAP